MLSIDIRASIVFWFQGAVKDLRGESVNDTVARENLATLLSLLEPDAGVSTSGYPQEIKDIWDIFQHPNKLQPAIITEALIPEAKQYLKGLGKECLKPEVDLNNFMAVIAGFDSELSRYLASHESAIGGAGAGVPRAPLPATDLSRTSTIQARFFHDVVRMPAVVFYNRSAYIPTDRNHRSHYKILVLGDSRLQFSSVLNLGSATDIISVDRAAYQVRHVLGDESISSSELRETSIILITGRDEKEIRPLIDRAKAAFREASIYFSGDNDSAVLSSGGFLYYHRDGPQFTYYRERALRQALHPDILASCNIDPREARDMALLLLKQRCDSLRELPQLAPAPEVSRCCSIC